MGSTHASLQSHNQGRYGLAQFPLVVAIYMYAWSLMHRNIALQLKWFNLLSSIRCSSITLTCVASGRQPTVWARVPRTQTSLCSTSPGTELLDSWYSRTQHHWRHAPRGHPDKPAGLWRTRQCWHLLQRGEPRTVQRTGHNVITYQYSLMILL